MSEANPSAPSFRADIEGLRAVAVGLVLASHAFGILRGGALGVDVFFVISGFVITSGLVREGGRAGGIDLREFYRRRARRILPLAAIVLATTVSLAAAVWFLPRALQVALDAGASATFVMNWHLIGAHAAYAHADDPVSPLQHFWSLAVEEQFYVVWPTLAVLAHIVARRRGAVARRWLLGATVVLGACSVAYCVFLTASDPGRAYFDSGARAWELLAGCAAALVFERLSNRTNRGAATVATWGGLALILVGGVTVPITSGFPWPGAVLPVAGALLIVLFGRGVISPLTLRPVRYVGRISFGLYLWHWPLLVLAEVIAPAASPWPAAGALGGSFVLAAVTYHFVEAPLLARGRRSRTPRTPPRLRTLWLPALAGMTIFVLAASQLRFNLRLSDPVVLLQSLGAEAYPSEGVRALSAAQLTRAVGEAASGRPWPTAVRDQLEGAYRDELAPAMDAWTGCRHDVSLVDLRPRTCTWGDANATRVAVVIGDSVAASWTSAIVGALVPRGWRVVALTYGGCSAADVDARGRDTGANFVEDCQRSRDRMFDLVRSTRPDLAILSSGMNLFDPLAESSAETAATAWQRGTERSLARVAPSAAATVVLGNPPVGLPPAECAARALPSDSCLTELDPLQNVKDEAERRATVAAASTGQRARFVEATGWFCSESGKCPAYVGDELVRGDQTHITNRMGLQLREVVGGELTTG